LNRFAIYAGACGLSLLPWIVAGGDIVTVKRLHPDLAWQLVKHTVDACRTEGYQVTAVVVDKDGAETAVLRDVHASRFTLQIARDKANAVILSGISSGAFRDNRRDIQQEMNHVTGVLVLQGGLPIQSAGYQLGAIGVSGAPGGERDEKCAAMGLAKIQEQLDFAE
jgi:uncharacterized protein GlcG (DUF336 family)